MKKSLICIECPNGCSLSVDIVEDSIIVTGNDCPKGEKYAIDETQNPVRILATTVLTKGFPLKLVPVRTNKPIPKNRLVEAMVEIKSIRLDREVNVDDIIVKNFLDLKVDLISTRQLRKEFRKEF